MENLTKENVYVKVESKEQAYNYAAVLRYLNQSLCDSFYVDTEYTSSNQDSLIYSLKKWTCGNKGNLKEITFGQLIDILMQPEKIAVRVDNEKEGKAICKFKSWDYPITAFIGKEPYVIYMDDKFSFNRLSNHNDGLSNYKIIPFSEFAKEHNIKLPIITTVDGVDLFEGDEYQLVKKFHATGNIWKICRKNVKLSSNDFVLTDPCICTAFSTIESAEKWINEQNTVECASCERENSKSEMDSEYRNVCKRCKDAKNSRAIAIIWNSILDEVHRAESKHPDWPTDKIYAVNIIDEELGEVKKEANKIQMNESDASLDNLRKETIQTAATCIRLLKNL